MANPSIGAYQVNVTTGEGNAAPSIGAYQVEYVAPTAGGPFPFVSFLPGVA